MHAKGGSQARWPFPPRETSARLRRAGARAVWAAVTVGALAAGRLEAAPVPVTFTIDAARSAISAEMGILLDFGFVVVPLEMPPQSAGISDQSSFGGGLTGQVDLVGKSLSLATTGLTLANSGNWIPATGQGFGSSAPAQFGFENSDFAPEVETFAALRGMTIGIAALGLTLGGSGPYSFSTAAVDWELGSGAFAYLSGFPLGGIPPTQLTNDLAGLDPQESTSGLGGLSQTGNLLELRVPLDLTFVAIEVDDGFSKNSVWFRLQGQITAVGQLPSDCVGDANGDGVVGAADYAIWAAQFGQTGARLTADFDGNGSIGAGDYALWAANFGKSCASGATPVPEPASWALACLGCACWGCFQAVKRWPRPTSR